MKRDPRGGHNQKVFNQDFFKEWSPKMAYVLGLITADGAIEDVRRSSRTCYTTIISKDRSLLEQVKKVFSSNHTLYSRKPRLQTFNSDKTYLCSETFVLRIGSKDMFQDLINLGITPRKSLRIQFPRVPFPYLKFFLRGYFDGDGCICIYIPKGRKAYNVQVTFTSGSIKFLRQLSSILYDKLQLGYKKLIVVHPTAYHLQYKKREGLKLLSYLYEDLDAAPYLKRKYVIFEHVSKELPL